MKKLLPIMIAAAMLCVVIPAVDVDTDAEPEPFLWVGKTAVTGDMDLPTWSFKSSTSTLTLRGLVLTGEDRHDYVDEHGDASSAAIYYFGQSTLNIVMEGKSTINSDAKFGIVSDNIGAMKISGNGTLNVTNENYKYAIYPRCGFTFEGGELNLVSDTDNPGSLYSWHENIEINSGVITCNNGLVAPDFNVLMKGGCVYASYMDTDHTLLKSTHGQIMIDGSPTEVNVDRSLSFIVKPKVTGEIYITYLKDKTVTFDANGGTCPTSTEKTDAMGKIDSLPDAERDGWIFAGWYTAKEGGERVTSTYFAKDTTVYAHWVDTRLIWFDAQGGDAQVLFEVTDINGKLRMIPDATKDGWRFGGWYTEPEGEGERVTKSTVFHENATVYAFWDDTRVVRFDAQGGDVDIPFELTDKEGKLRMIPTVEREGYIFEGWYTEPNGGEKITADTEFHTDAMAYAHWKMDITTGCIAAGITAALALVIVAVSILLVRKH